MINGSAKDAGKRRVKMNNNYGAPQGVDYQQPPMQPQMPMQPQLPMKWFKFLAYFGLWAGAVLNFIMAIVYMTGGHYGALGASLVYMVFPAMKTLDVFLGIVCFIMVAYGVITALSLLKFKAIAPKLVVGLYIITGVVNVLYQIIGVAIIGEGFPIVDVIVYAGVAVLWAVLNKIYFGKRAHLFNK